MFLPSEDFLNKKLSLCLNFVNLRYGIEAITQVPGWCERLVERRYSVDRDAQNQRFSLILAIKRSPVIEVWLLENRISYCKDCIMHQSAATV